MEKPQGKKVKRLRFLDNEIIMQLDGTIKLSAIVFTQENKSLKFDKWLINKQKTITSFQRFVINKHKGKYINYYNKTTGAFIQRIYL
jgi:hypothetical protein